jgi:cytochrome c
VTRNILAATLLSCLTLTMACARTDGATGGAGTPDAAAAAAQVDRGAQVFGQSCAKCHGASGQGTDKAPALVGQGALPLDPPAGRKFRKARFRTAQDVAAFVVPNMPPPPAPRLSGPEAWAVLAFALSANGVELTEPVGPDNAAAIVLH